MSVLIRGMAMPKSCLQCPFRKFWDDEDQCLAKKNLWVKDNEIPPVCPLVELPPHGDLIDRDALMKDGWLSLWKRVDYMGGYAVHDLPLINPSIPVVIESEGEK